MCIRDRLWTSILAYFIIQGIILFFLFPTFRQGSSQAKWLLAGLSLLSAIVISEDFIDSIDGYETFPHLIFVCSPFWYALCPLLFLYIRLYLTGKSVSWTDALHFLPVVAVFFNTLHFYGLSPEFKIQYYQLAEQHRIHPVHNLNYILFTSQCLVYLFASIVTLHKNGRRNAIKGELRWLLMLIMILVLVTGQSIFSLIMYNSYLLADWTGALYYLSLSLFLVLLFIRSMRHPKTIYLIGRPSTLSSNYDGAVMDFQNLQHFMTTYKPYLNKDFGIEQLAHHLGFSKHRLTKLIREQTQKSFRDYINTFRVNEVKERLRSHQSERYTIEFIAIESGFASQATFYRVFRRIEGMTPKAFMKDSF